jgi:hypothetical protein
MADLDPVQSIRDAIAHLEDETSTVETEIRRVRANADTRIAELEASIATQRQDLRRWRAALACAEGRVEPSRVRNARSSAAAPSISDEELLGALRDLGEPASAPQLRAALGVDPDVPAGNVTRLVTDAVERGVLARTGQRRGTRYTAA